MPSMAALFLAAKMFVFVEFRSILVIPGDVFDVDYVSFERSSEAAISREAAARTLFAIVYT